MGQVCGWSIIAWVIVGARKGELGILEWRAWKAHRRELRELRVGSSRSLGRLSSRDQPKDVDVSTQLRRSIWYDSVEWGHVGMVCWLGIRWIPRLSLDPSPLLQVKSRYWDSIKGSRSIECQSGHQRVTRRRWKTSWRGHVLVQLFDAWYDVDITPS